MDPTVHFRTGSQVETTMKTITGVLRRWKATLFVVVVTLTVVGGYTASADQVDGKDASGSMTSGTYRHESVAGPGRDLGDGTLEIYVSCEPGERLLSGWPVNLASTSTLLESSAKDSNTWSARINKNGWTDDFSAEVLCTG